MAPRKATRKRRPAGNDCICAVDVIAFIETVCNVPEGRFVGQPLRLLPFQKEIIREIYDNPAGTRRAIISMPRKNAKSALAACLLLNHLCGPSARHTPNAQLYSAAQSRDQAALIFNLACKMIRMSPILTGAITIRETIKELACTGLGTKYRAISADATMAYGLSPSFIVFDELGQVRGPRSQLFEALETATGAQANPLSVIISTQAPTNTDLLSLLVDDALRGIDPRVVVRLYTAPSNLDPFDIATIRMANPALGHFLNEVEVMSMARDAHRMPARENEFRNLILNQRVETVTPFISAAVWKNCNASPAPLDGLTVYAGLDLSEVADLTALVLIGFRGGKWHVHPTFWLPEEGIVERSRTDRTEYDRWAREGYIETTPGRTVSYEFVAHRLREIFDQHRIERLSFDRWNMKHLRPWLLKAGFSEVRIDQHFVEFGQGHQSMSPAMRDFEQAVLSGAVAHGDHPVLSMCINNTVVALGEGGSKKPSKRRSTGRIDGAVALCMAFGVAPMQNTKVIDVETLIV
jgi:phage terminase large subunit-like protein